MVPSALIAGSRRHICAMEDMAGTRSRQSHSSGLVVSSCLVDSAGEEHNPFVVSVAKIFLRVVRAEFN